MSKHFTTRFVSTALAAALVLGYPSLSRAIDDFGPTVGAAGSTHKGDLEPGREAARAAAYSPTLRDRLSVFVDDANAGQFEAGAAMAVAQRGKWRAFISVETYAPTANGRADVLPAGAGLADDPVAGSAQARFSSTMSPIAASHQRFRQFTELRFSSNDVLLEGDSLTVRAGSDLRFLLQGIGIAGWADDAAAWVGWRSRLEVRWARPTTVGEFSFLCRVDRRANELGRGQILAHWEARL
jgi:hypothetical protein